MSVRDDTLQALDDTFRSAREIARRVGQWAEVTIKTTLIGLAHEGCVERSTAIGKNGLEMRLYRRKG